MSSAELSEYMAYDHFEPIGEARADLRAGIVASTVANFAANPPRKPAKPVDYMPFAHSFKDAQEAIELQDPAEHAKLIGKTLFGEKVSNYSKKED